MSSFGYSSAQLEQWGDQLNDLAQQQPRSRSKRAAVEELIEPIQQALTRHSYEAVAQQLTEWGLGITPGSLKQYVCQYRRNHNLGRLHKASRKRSDRPTQGEFHGERNSENIGESQYVPDAKLSHQRKINSSDNAEVESKQLDELKCSSAATEHEQSAPESPAWTEPRFNLNRIRPH
jgi:hypothetical protein